MIGSIDVFTTRRTMFDECEYWKRDNEDVDLETLVHETKSSGKFFAKEVTAQNNQKNIIGGEFMFDENSINIMTYDYVDIVAGDVVKFDKEYWNVENTQKNRVHRTQQFLDEDVYATYISLRR